MKNVSGALALLSGAACLLSAGSAVAQSKTIPGWPAYIAMGAIGGPNITPPTSTSTGGNDDFGGKPVDVVFKYAGFNGAGDPGIIVAPTNVMRMTSDLTTLSAINNRAMRVAIVEYTAQMSGGENLDDFSNGPATQNQPGTFILARHLIGLGADSLAMNDKPVVFNGQNYFGSLILNPDMLGAIQQGSGSTVPQPLISKVNAALPAGRVNQAVDQALCFLTTSRTYLNNSNPNGVTAPYVGKTYTGTPVAIVMAMYADGYPAWSLESSGDVFWNNAMNNLVGGTGSTYSQVGVWFNSCATNPTYNTANYSRPNFPAGLDGWVQANNWIVRTMSAKGRVTFGWQENVWANPDANGFWVHKPLSDAQIASTYSTPVSTWLQANAPTAITTGALGANFVPDYFVFDRYEFDDNVAPGAATLYNARSWDNYLTGAGQISKNFNNIPVMLWQIPGGHIPYTNETQPETVLGAYVFSTAPVYFFGDSNLASNLSNMVTGPIGNPVNPPGVSVGNWVMDCAATTYNCPTTTPAFNYKQYLLYYKGVQNNYDWRSGNGRLAFAASNNVFSILWGGGNTTNVIKNFSNPDDHGWLANKIIAYYQSPTPLTPATTTAKAPHDFNGDAKSDILWRNTSGETGMWLMNGGALLSTPTLGVVPNNWSIVGQRDFNGDGKSDLLWLNSVGDIGIWFMNGGTLVSQGPLGNVGTTWKVVGTGDFNGDGKADILWRNTSGDLGIWFMNGGTLLSTAPLGNIPAIWSVQATGDFNGDGKADILWRNTSNDVGLWLMNGGTVLSTPSLGNVGATWSIAGTGDFNGDGKADILWRSTSNDVGLWLMNGGTLLSTPSLGNVGATWNVTSVGDYNGDGKADILWRSTSHDIGIWFMNGGTLTSTAPLGNVGSAWLVQNAASN